MFVLENKSKVTMLTLLCIVWNYYVLFVLFLQCKLITLTFVEKIAEILYSKIVTWNIWYRK